MTVSFVNIDRQRSDVEYDHVGLDMYHIAYGDVQAPGIEVGGGGIDLQNRYAQHGVFNVYGAACSATPSLGDSSVGLNASDREQTFSASL